MSGVVVVGSLNIDLHLLLRRHILPGETLLAGGGTFSPGGKGANQACAAALAGAPARRCWARWATTPQARWRRRGSRTPGST